MSSDPNDQPRLSSGESEQECLNSIHNTVPDVFGVDPGDTVIDPFPTNNIVRIPDLSSRSPESETAERRRSERVGTVEVAKQISLGVGLQVSKLPVAELVAAKRGHPSETVSELSEKPSDWMGGGSGKSDDKDRGSVKSSASGDNKGPIQTLVAKILERFQFESGATLLFASAGNLVEVDESSAQVAKCLSEQNIGRVLLVDSDFEKSALSHASGKARTSGLRETMASTTHWKDSIVAGSKTPMDFLPVGGEEIRFWEKANSHKKELTVELRKEYRFVCISVGDSHSDAACYWADLCDGAILLVSLENTSQTLARTAVDQLRCNGARMLGCIVVDAPSRSDQY